MNAQSMNPEPAMNPRETGFRGRLRDISTTAAPTVWEYAGMVFSRKWLVLALTLLSVTFAISVVSLMTPYYRATNTLLIDGARSKVVSIEELYGISAGSREFFQTQALIMNSSEVGLRVVREMNLIEHPYFDARQPNRTGFAYNLKSRLREYPFYADRIEPILIDIGLVSTEAEQPSTYQFTTEQLEKIALRRLRPRIEIWPIQKSQLVEVRVESPDPQLAADIANELGLAYVQADLDARYELQNTASKWLNERLAKLGENLDESEQALQAYREDKGLIATPTSAMGGNVRSLDTASDRLINARIRLAEAAQTYRQVRSGSEGRYTVPEVFNNPAVSQARFSKTAAEKRVLELEQSLGASHPLLQSAKSELEAAEKNLIQQSEAVIASIEKRYEVARGTVRAIEQQVQDSRGSIRDINRKEGELNVLEREVATNRQVYETFLARSKETEATSDFRTPIARSIDEAAAPLAPIKPRKTQIVLLSAAVGALLASLLAIVLELRRAVIRSSDDVEDKLNLPLLVAAPQAEAKSTEDVAMIQHKQPATLFAEAIRTAVTGVHFSTMEIGTPVIAVTSTVPDEGKTTVAINFAIEMARTKKTLLIDADLRKAGVASALRLEPAAPGLTEHIAGEVSEACIQHVYTLNLSVMTTGKKPINAHDLLLGSGFARQLAGLKNEFECIIIDTPPVDLVSDAIAIGREASGVIYVVRADSTPIPMIRRCTERLIKANSFLFGVFLNGHDFKRAGQFYGEYSAQGKYGYAKQAAYGR